MIRTEAAGVLSPFAGESREVFASAGALAPNLGTNNASVPIFLFKGKQKRLNS
jgi:hypothetical protein